MSEPNSQAEATQNPQGEQLLEEIENNPGMRAAALRANPTLSLEEARNAAAGETPNAAGGSVTSDAENAVPSSSNPNPSNLPSTDHPIPDSSESD
ncbi:MAG: hypothetical protein MUF72_22805 [Elainella sp. Prado103]|jgi:hypothetical protein|nr:hypothetical protein [Elainella sp. Prado103]